MGFKVPPYRERQGQRPKRHVICKAPEEEPRVSFIRLANHMTFSSLTATLSARWDFNTIKSSYEITADATSLSYSSKMFLNTYLDLASCGT